MKLKYTTHTETALWNFLFFVFRCSVYKENTSFSISLLSIDLFNCLSFYGSLSLEGLSSFYVISVWSDAKFLDDFGS